MKAASTKTYISKRQMDKYREQRAVRLQAQSQQQQESQQPKLKKNFAEDEEEKKEAQPPQMMAAQAQPMAAAASQPVQMQVEEEPQKKSGGFLSSLKSAFTFSASKQAPALAKNKEAVKELDRNLSCEEMDSDDLGGDLNLSDNEDGANERAFRRDFRAQKRAVTHQKANVYAQEFDTNVFEVKLDCLADKG